MIVKIIDGDSEVTQFIACDQVDDNRPYHQLVMRSHNQEEKLFNWETIKYLDVYLLDDKGETVERLISKR